MQIPVVHEIARLSPSTRKFLLSLSTSIVSFNCIMGAVLILFARRIDMPPDKVGLLLSFLPISSIMVIFAVSLVYRFGPHRLIAASWLGRTLAATPILLLPLVIQCFGPVYGWILLLACSLLYSVIQNIGATGWFPLLHEIIPDSDKSAYFSSEAVTGHVCAISVSVLVAFILGEKAGPETPLSRFLIIYSIGIAAGFLGFYLFRKIPGGRVYKGPISQDRTWRGTYGPALKDKGYMRFVGMVALCMCSACWLNAANIMYLRDVLELPGRTIMLLLSSGSLGIALTVHPWGRHADSQGSPNAIALSMGGYSLVAFFWLFLLPKAPWNPYILTPLIVVGSILMGAFWVTAMRGMLGQIKEEGKIGYTNLWIVCTAAANAITPILVGQVIRHGGIWGFRGCFLISCLGCMACAATARHLPDIGRTDVNLLDILMRPTQPGRTLAKILWISLGMDDKMTGAVRTTTEPLARESPEKSSATELPAATKLPEATELPAATPPPVVAEAAPTAGAND